MINDWVIVCACVRVCVCVSEADQISSFVAARKYFLVISWMTFIGSFWEFGQFGLNKTTI